MTSVIPPQMTARLRRVFGRFVGPAAVMLFSLVLASCAGGGFGGAGDVSDVSGVNPVSEPVSAAAGPISPASQRKVAEVVSGLELGEETPPISPEDIAVSNDSGILDSNPFSSPAPAARSSGWGARADSTRKTAGYKAFEIAVPSENPLMTVAVWISETPPDYPEGKPEQDPESDRKFLYLRLQVFIAVEHVALVEGGGVEVLETNVIVVEEKRPDPKPQPQPTVVAEPQPACGTGEFRNGEGSCAPILGADLLCPSGTMPANGLTQEELDAGLFDAGQGSDDNAWKVCEYLRRGANIHATDVQDFSPILRAFQSGFSLPLKVLAANGANVNDRQPPARLYSLLDSAAFWISRGKNLPLYGKKALILREAGATCHYLDPRQYPACLGSSDSGSVPVATPDPVTSETVCESGSLSANGQTQAQLDAGLISAAEGDDLAGACEYLRRGANVDARESGRYHRRTALMIAANDGFLDLAKLLHANGADVNLHGGSHDGGLYGRGWSALHYSAVAGNVEIARWLLDAGAELESTWDGVKTALWEASYWGRPGVVELLLSRGADVSRSPGDLSGIRAAVRETTVNYPYTRTMLSYYYPKPSADSLLLVVSLLASGGAELNERRRGGRSILDEAVNRDNARVAKVLRQFGGKCFLETGPLCGVAEVVTAETICESGSLSANGLTQAQLDAGLISAAEGNNLGGACEYLRRGANVDARESGRYYKRTALMIATTDGRLELAKLLYANGADVNLDGGNHNGYDVGRGWTALQYSGAAGRPELAGWLLDSGAELNSEWESGKTALWEAAYWGRPDVVELLLSRGAETETYYNGGATPLHAAVLLDEWVSARVYWANGPAFRYKRNAISYSYPIPTADEHGQVVSLLLSHDAEVNARYQGRSPLDYAARQGDERLSAMLRDAGGICYVETGALCGVAEVVTAETVCESGSLSANGLTQAQLDAGLISAAEDDGLESACEYLRRGANVDARESGRYYKRTALMIAANDGFLDLAKLLHTNGANVNLHGGTHDGNVYGRGLTALHYAGAAGRSELARWLLDSGAELNAEWVTGQGKTALWEAAYWGRPDVVELLLSRGAETETYYNGGATPLHAAVLLDEWVSARVYWANGPAFRYKRNAISYSYPIPTADEHGQVVSLLLSHDAEVNARYQGRSPLDYAARQGDERLSAMLRDAGGICYVETGALCGVAEVVTAETVCESGSLSADGQTQAELDEGLLSEARDNDLAGVCEYLRRGADVDTLGHDDRPGGYYHRSALMIAADGGFLELAKLLHANEADLNVQGGGPRTDGGRYLGWTALNHAANGKQSGVAAWLLDNGVDVNKRWRWDRIALHDAAYAGGLDVVNVMLSRGADVAARDVWGWTPLFFAVAQGMDFRGAHTDRMLAVISALAAAGADVNAMSAANPSEPSYWRTQVDWSWGWYWHNRRAGRTPLDLAVRHGRSEYVELLRSLGGVCHVQTGPLCGEVQVAVGFSSSGSGTVSAEEDGDALSDGDEVRQGATVIFTAAPAAGHYVSGWSGNCAEIGEVADGLDGTAKVCAAAADSALSVRAEFSEIPSLAGSLCPSGSLSANGLAQAELDAGLISAAQANNLEDVCEYLRRGASVEAQEQSGTYRRTALMIAAYDRYLELAQLLHANGADVNSRVGNGGMGGRANPGRWRTHGDSGFTALMYAAGAAGAAGAATAAGRAEMIGWLLDNGADPNLGDSRGRLPLFEAAFYGRVDVMGLLLDGGADVDGADVWGLVPLHAAGPHYNYGSGPEWSYAATVAGYLLSRGANVNALDSWGRSPLDMYAEWSHPNAAAVLRNAGGKCFVQTGPLCGVDVAVGFSSSGSGTVSAEGDGDALSDGDNVRQGATVMFTATPAAGHYVSGWSGNCAEIGTVADGLDGTAKSCAVSADSDLSVRAEFSEIPSLAGPLCPSGSLSANGLTQAQLDAGLISEVEDNDLEGTCEYLRKGADIEVVYTPALRSGVAIKRTPLVIAAANGRLELSRFLLNNGANVDWQSGRTLPESDYDGGAGWSALALAAAAGHGDVVGLLLDQGANVDIQWDFGRTALHEAAIFGRASVVELLLARGAAVDVRDLNGETALHGAAWGASPGGHHTHVSRSTWEAKWDKALDLLLDAGAEVNLRSTRTSDWGHGGRVFVNEGWNGGWTPLDRAIAANKRSRALKLRSRGGVCNVQSGSLCPPTSVAVGFSSSGSGTVSAEGEGGALSDGDEVRQGATVMFTAAPAAGHYVSGWSGNCAEAGEVADGLDGAAKLCAAAADSALSVRAEFSEIPSLAGPLCPSGSLSANGLAQAELDAGLISAAQANNLEDVCEYLRRGASVEAQEQSGTYRRTALMIAAYDRYLELAQLLHANGADVNSRVGNGGMGGRANPGRWRTHGDSGFTALMYAAGAAGAAGAATAAGRAEMIGWLLDNGADPNLGDSRGRLPLFEAAFYGRVDVMGLLLDGGADVDGADVWGLVPLHAAGPHYNYGSGPEWSYAATVAGYLLSRGANVNALDSWGRSPLDMYAEWSHPNAAAVLRNAGGKCFVQTGPLCGVDVAVGFSSSGSGTVSAEGDGDALSDGDNVRQGATVMFTATPAAGHYVSGWSGNCAEIGTVADGLDGTAKSCAVSADSDLSVRAEFSEIPSLAGPLCPSGSLSANGLTQAQLDAGLLSEAGANDSGGVCEYLRRGANIEARDRFLATDGLHRRTPLMLAAVDNRLELAKLLVGNGASVNYQSGGPDLERQDGAGWSALMYAAGAGQVETATYLLDQGAEIDMQWASGYSALHEAAIWGRYKTVKLLIARGANVNLRDYALGGTPLHGASWGANSGHFTSTRPSSRVSWNKVIKALLDGGADVNARRDVDDRPPSYGGGASPLDSVVVANKSSRARKLRDAGGYCYVQISSLCAYPPVAVTVNFSSSGSGTVSAEGDGDALSDGDNVRQGATVMFTATPAAGHYVSGWSGNCADAGGVADGLDGTAKSCSVSADSDLSVRAEFSEIPSLAGPLCPSESLSANGLTTAELNMTLRLAARGGDAARVCEALRRGAEVNDNLDDSEFTPLQEAVSGGHLDAVKLLLANGAEVNKRKDGAGHSPLDLAARDGEAEIAALLRNADGRCFLETGPLCEDVPVATSDPVTVVNTVAATVANTIVATVANTVVAAVENTVASTVAAGSCPAGTLDAGGMSQWRLDNAMLEAVRDGDVAEVCEYLRRGANVNAHMWHPMYPLVGLVLVRDNVEMAKLLLANGADVNWQGPGGNEWPPLFHALSPEVVRLYLSHGADPNLSAEDNWSPLHEATYWNRREVMEILLAGGADPNTDTSRTSWRGGTPLHYVRFVVNGTDTDRALSALAVSVLLAGGADPNARDHEGRSPLDWAMLWPDAVAAMELLRAAGGQCFVSTSPLCGSAPAPAAAESAPAADRLRERFAGAFNPSPAFGDAFGAVSGSSEGFLTRLNSLMRSSAGTGGNAWDSFAGWQRENEHGRMWFSTGQRGDFGFGAGGNGAGGDLSASPFAALVGNGMLAGGETGFAADGKLRVAAFADYQAKSLLDGEDKQWTQWAARGTAIETAMTEAERFSGLSENQTRGAMTEIHLGGGDLGVALQAGAVSESDSVLSGTAGDESLRGLRSRTAFAGLSGAANLFGSGWRLRGSAHLGRSWAESEGMLLDSDLWASAFSAGLERGGWLYSDDGFVLRFSQPLRVENWDMELIGDDGAGRLGADASGRQLDVDAAYRLPLSGGGWLLLSAGIRRDGGHSSSSDLEAGALFSVERGF